MIIPLSHAHYEEPEVVGEKAHRLGIAASLGVPIVPGVVITSRAFGRFLERNNLHTRISHWLGILDPDNPRLWEEVYSDWHRHASNLALPEEITAKLAGSYVSLGPNVLLTPSRVSLGTRVATSAPELQQGLLDIWKDSLSPGVLIELRKSGTDSLPKLSVLVQTLLFPDSLFLAYTSSPNSVAKNKYSVKLADEFLDLPKHSLSTISSKYLDKKLLGQIWRVLKLLDQYFYLPQEILFAVQKDKLYVQDIRPYTGFIGSQTPRPHRVRPDVPLKSPVALGKPITPGIKSGTLYFAKDTLHISIHGTNAIALCHNLKKFSLSQLRRLHGLLLRDRLLPAQAQKLRKIGLVTISEVGDALEEIKRGTVITIDGKTGKIFLGKN